VTIALVWDNFGPLHDDRLRACIEHFSDRKSVVGVEINGRSDVYSWENRRSDGLPKFVLFPENSIAEISDFALFRSIASCIVAHDVRHIFLCHYERAGTLWLAWLLRLMGRRVYVMGCPKFDDRPRSATKEFLKQLFLSPYHGALVGGPGTREYFAFLGLSRKPIALGYNTVSTRRIREIANQDGKAVEPAHEERDFVVVARLVPKKNIDCVIRAYGRFVDTHPTSRRRLHICGDGPLEGDLRALTGSLGLAERVTFHGFLQSKAVVQILQRALALLLVSVEEQFGNVVPEALSLGIPLILSDACGARYELLRTGVNGFVVEPDNVEGLAYFMGLLDRDAALWARLSKGAFDFSSLGDATRFAEGVEALIR
jgi:glycosyltransferase involved in cell wall biosynthesis